MFTAAKRATAGVMLGASIIVSQAILAETASASTTDDTVMADTQRMNDHTLDSTQDGTYSAGSHLTLECYAHGQSVKGYFSSSFPDGYDYLWYQVDDGHWVADVDIDTHSNDPVTPACSSSSTSVDTFVSNTSGQSLANAQGSYQGECVSLVSQFLLQVHGITTGSWGNAVDYRAGGTGGNHLSDAGFTWSDNSNFQNGDIVVWGGGSQTSDLGHIAVWYNGKIYDQNYGGRRTAGLDSYFSSGYLGRWSK